eukprot:gene11383-7888_t
MPPKAPARVQAPRAGTSTTKPLQTQPTAVARTRPLAAAAGAGAGAGPRQRGNEKRARPPALGDPSLEADLVLLRCADGSGLDDATRRDSRQPHPHRPPLRSLKTFDDVLRSRIAALGSGILRASPNPVSSASSALKTGRQPPELKPPAGLQPAHPSRSKAPEGARRTHPTVAAPASAPPKAHPSVKDEAAAARLPVGAACPSKQAVPSSSSVVFVEPGQTSTTAAKEMNAAPITPATPPMPEGASKGPAPVSILVAPAVLSSSSSSAITAGGKANQQSATGRFPQRESLAETSPSSFPSPHSTSSAAAQSFESTAPVCVAATSIPGPSGRPIGISASEQQRVEACDSRAVDILQRRSHGSGVVLASSAAPLYDEAYAAYRTDATHKDPNSTWSSSSATGRRTRTSTSTSTSTPTSSSIGEKIASVSLLFLGGAAMSPTTPVLHRSHMSQEEVANALYLAARGCRASVERNYYQVLHIIWQSPLQAGSSFHAMNTSRGDPLPTGSGSGSSTHRRRRLELRYLRDVYTRMPLLAMIGNAGVMTARFNLGTARGLTTGRPPDTGKGIPALHSSSTSSHNNTDENACRSTTRLSFLLRFEQILLASGDMHPGPLRLPRGHFDVTIAPDTKNQPPTSHDDVCTTAGEGEEVLGGALCTARYADQCMDWCPLYPHLSGVHLTLPTKLVTSQPHLQDYAVVDMEGAIRPHHDRGGAVSDELPERIAFHVLLAPSSVSSQLLPTLAAGCMPSSSTAAAGSSQPSLRRSSSFTGNSSFFAAPTHADVLMMDTQSTPSQETIVVSASAHRHVRRRTLFGPSVTSGPQHRLHSIISLQVRAAREEKKPPQQQTSAGTECGQTVSGEAVRSADILSGGNNRPPSYIYIQQKENNNNNNNNNSSASWFIPPPSSTTKDGWGVPLSRVLCESIVSIFIYIYNLIGRTSLSSSYSFIGNRNEIYLSSQIKSILIGTTKDTPAPTRRKTMWLGYRRAAGLLAASGTSATSACRGMCSTPVSSPCVRRRLPLAALSSHPPSLLVSLRGVKLVNPSGKQGSQHYGADPKPVAGQDVQLKHTEMYDGYTDDFGVFKEGPPVALRLEYVRSPAHSFSQMLLQKDIWSPFQVGKGMMHYTPLYYDWMGFSSRDYWGHRSGTNPGSKVMLGHYKRNEQREWGQRIFINHKPQRRVPKWLACVVHMPRQKTFLGFFLYANGAYVAELLTYKQLPRLVYNKPFQNCLPTLGQAVALSEVTYGKEVHSVEMYPGYGGVLCRASGTAAMVLRGTESHLVPLLLPSKEVRLFDQTCNAVFGRRAGVMYKHQRNFGARNVEANNPHRPRVHSKSKRVSSHPAGGGNGGSTNLLVPLDWRLHPRNSVKSKYWLSGYILRGRQYNKHQTVADAKSVSYSWANRDPVYR